MTLPRPPEPIRLHWGDHMSALRWLSLLYRRPTYFQDALKRGVGRGQLKVGLVLLLHSLPYAVLLLTLARLLLGSAPKHVSSKGDLFAGIAVGITGGIIGGIVGGIIGAIWVGITKGISVVIVRGIAVGIGVGIGGGVADWIVRGILNGTANGIATGTADGIAVGIAFGIAIGITDGFVLGFTMAICFSISIGSAVAIAFGNGIGFTIACGITLVIVLLRMYYHWLHPLFIWPKLRGRGYQYHPAAWDDLCLVPFPGLDRLLAAYSEQNWRAAEAEIERLITTYPAQRRQALRARVRLVARQAGRAVSLARLDEIVAKLPEGENGFLGQTRQLREWANEIAAQQVRLDMNDRPFFKEPTAQLLYTKIEIFQHRIAGFKEPLATEFRSAAQCWKEVACRQLEEAQAIVSKKPAPQVFRAGDPVDRDKEAFVPRDGIVGQVEQQVMLGTGCPGIVLYGRRRTGKSTVLRNLSGFLPASTIPVAISMQDPRVFTSPESFAHRIAAEVGSKIGLASARHDISGFYDFLTSCNSRLQSEGKRLLLGVDEYELLDTKIAEGTFTEDLLITIRESIQSHPNITWVFSGSHEITELTGAPWTSYLVSARTIEVPAFRPSETRLLLTDPVKYSSFWEKDEPRRPRFEPGFWGEGGIDRIHEEAGGWPHLVQLIAEAVVDLINTEEARSVSPGLLEHALAQCVVRGHTVLYELMCRECTLPGEWEYLSSFRSMPEQLHPRNQAIYRSLRRREIITEENGYWRLRVPLMTRWLRQRG